MPNRRGGDDHARRLGNVHHPQSLSVPATAWVPVWKWSLSGTRADRLFMVVMPMVGNAINRQSWHAISRHNALNQS